MKDARETIEGLLDKMRTLLLAAGVPKAQIHMRNGAFKISTCNKAFDWLHNLYTSPEYTELEYVYSLRTPEIWNRYKVLQIEGLAEQALLEKASKALVKLWRRQRPTMFAKNRKTDKDPKIQPMDSCRL